MNRFIAATCAGLALWCSLGTIGFVGEPPSLSRMALLAPWWTLPLFIAGFFGLIRVLRFSPHECSTLLGSAVLLLPWLPIPLPAAALIWTGPVAFGVWMVIAAGVLVMRGRTNAARWFGDARRAPITAATLALAVYGLSATWLSPILPDGDEPHYLILAQSLIEDGDIRIENNHKQGDYLAYSLNAAAPDYLRRGVNGEIYSIHAPGLAILIAPAMWLAGYRGVVAFLGLIAALSTALVWWIGYQATGRIGSAWFGWCACALTTPFLFQATEVFPDGIAATCLLIGTLPLVESGVPAASHRSVWQWIASGIALAMLPWLQTRLAVVAVAAALCVLVRIRTRSQLLAFVGVPVVSALIWFGFFIIVYGTPDPTAAYGPYTQTSLANLVRGFPGLLFDQQFGLIPNAPVYAFVLVGVLTAAFTLRRWALETLAIVIPYMLAVGSYQMWWGGTSVPARLLTAITLLSGVAAARVWSSVQSRASHTLGMLTLIASVFIAGVLLIPEHGRLLLNFRDGISLWLEWANPLVDLPRGLPSLFHDGRSQLWMKAAIWSASAILVWIVFWGVEGPRAKNPDEPWVSATSILVGCLGVMLAFTLTWRLDRTDPLTPQTAAIALMQHVGSLRSTAFDFRTRTLMPTTTIVPRLTIATDRQRRPGAAPTLLTTRDLPAGTYRLLATFRRSAKGTLTVRVGDTKLPLATIDSAVLEKPSSTAQFQLSAPVRSLVVDGDTDAQATAAVIQLQPIALRSSSGMDTDRAHRAAQFSAGDVFFLDEHAYAEPTGFWVAGGRMTTAVFHPNHEHIALFLRNAPVDNVIDIETDGGSESVTLQPGEERLVRLPETGDQTIHITSRSGFRPSVTEPGSTDLRYLGCWVELR